jgi:AcrR family transcriptional regulator
MPEMSARQKEIIEAAIHLISKGGIQELTTKNLAARLKLSEPALYRHFKNKRDILHALLKFFQGNQKAMYARVAASGDPPLRTLERMIVEVFRGFAAKPAMATVIFAEGMFQNDSRLSAVIYSIMDERQAQFAALIGEGQARGEVRKDIDKGQLAMLAMGSMRLLVTRWRLSGFAFDLVGEGEKLSGTLRKLLG